MQRMGCSAAGSGGLRNRCGCEERVRKAAGVGGTWVGTRWWQGRGAGPRVLLVLPGAVQEREGAGGTSWAAFVQEVVSRVLCGGCQSLQTALLNPTSLSPCCRSLRA